MAWSHPTQHGRASMKAVLPVLTGVGYDTPDIRDGIMASREYLRVTFGRVTPEEQLRVRHQIQVPCGQDTEGMIHIPDRLRKLLAQI